MNKFSKADHDTTLFKDNGDGYDIHPAGVLMLMADAAYDGGYTQGDILMTLLARSQVTQRTKDMAIEAMTCAGNERINEVFDAMQNKK